MADQIESEQIRLGEKKKSLIAENPAADEKVQKIEMKIKENNVALEKLRRESSDAARYKDLVDRYLAVRKMERQTPVGETCVIQIFAV